MTLARGRWGLLAAAAAVAGALCGSGSTAGQPAGPSGGAVGPAWSETKGQSAQPPTLMREFRGVWVATVANIDWPSKPGLPVESLRAEMTRILDAAAGAGLNAVVLQVRPACDAIYPSALEPWSEFLTGRSGSPIAGTSGGESVDPLAEWVREAHARGMELHAWINPFRARHFESRHPDAASHVSNAHPEWVRRYNRYLWLDPGHPGARAHSLAVVDDLLARYDLDGIHFDDYFYPYPEGGQAFPDDETYGAYRREGGTLDRDAWRRENIDGFVRDLYQRAKARARRVKVGISPFGIWRPGNPPAVRGFDAFAGLHADARRWVREGWLDYVSPQLYWKLEAPQQPFARLLDWWIDQNDQQRHVWPGLYASRVLPAGETGKDGNPAPSWEPGDVVAQVMATRASGGASGTVLFSAKALVENRRGLADALRAGPFAPPALVPESPWLRRGIATEPAKTPEPARVLRVNDEQRGTVVLLEAPRGGVGDVARWLGVWEQRGGTWSLRVRRARTPLGTEIQSGEPVEVVLLHGAGDRVLTGIGVFWVDGVGGATPTTVWQRGR